MKITKTFFKKLSMSSQYQYFYLFATSALEGEFPPGSPQAVYLASQAKLAAASGSNPSALNTPFIPVTAAGPSTPAAYRLHR